MIFRCIFKARNESSVLKSKYYFSQQVSRNEKQWRQWFDKEAPEEEVIPDGYNNSLDVFRRLLLVRSWCPDRTMSQARKYIADTLGDKYAEGVILDLEKMWSESNSRTPMVCLLSMGSDPTNNIEALAKKLKLGQLIWIGKFFFLKIMHFVLKENANKSIS